jgi:alkylated DNA repair protein (DNA oxidative demethylase)
VLSHSDQAHGEPNIHELHCPMEYDLFDDRPATASDRQPMADGAVLLRGKALAYERGLLSALARVTERAPFRHMVTPGGFTMSVAMTNCGRAGWITDRSGYRYEAVDPESGKRWPVMPAVFSRLGREAASDAGYSDFVPDACLINRYVPGARLILHQDKNERDFGQPIVSVSLGLPAVFQFGGLERSAPVAKYILKHGDVAVWGGVSRLRYHGVGILKDGKHSTMGSVRINLTFRCAF